MFYCDACGSARGWPSNLGGRSYGPCEICKTPSLCLNVPSSALPKQPHLPRLDEMKDAPRAKDVADLSKTIREIGAMQGDLPSQYIAMVMARVQSAGALLAVAINSLDLHEPEEVKQILEAIEDDPALVEYVTGLLEGHPQLYEGPCSCPECEKGNLHAS